MQKPADFNNEFKSNSAVDKRAKGDGCVMEGCDMVQIVYGLMV